MSEVINVEWKNIGTLEVFPPANYDVINGVYLFVYDNKIIYIGESGNIFIRVKHHVINFKNGLGTMWNPSEGESVYDLMNKNYHKYSKLESDHKVWIPSSVVNLSHFHGYSFKEWQDANISINDYLKKITVWVGKINPTKDEKTDKEKRTLLETAIQINLQHEFQISYYSDSTEFCWLGKLEHSLQAIIGLEAHSRNLPDLEENSLKVLKQIFK